MILMSAPFSDKPDITQGTHETQIVPLDKALELLDLDHFPATPLGETSNDMTKKEEYSAGEEDKGRKDKLCITVYKDSTISIQNSFQIEGQPEGIEGSSYGFKGRIMYGGPNKHQLALDEVFFERANISPGDQNHIEKPTVNMVETLLKSFKKAMEHNNDGTGYAIGSSKNKNTGSPWPAP